MAGEANESSTTRRAAEVLEVEDEDQRQERMHSLLARLNTPSNAGSATLPSSRPFDFGDRSTHPIAPPMELLSRVQAFLPELAASNADLLRRARENPESVDIENIDEDQEQYIEMNLGLGVFDHRGDLPPGIPVTEVDLDAQMDSSDSSSDSDSDSDEDSSEDSDDSSSEDESSSEEDSSSEADGTVPSDQKQKVRPRKPLPKRKDASGAPKPEIVVLSETVDDPMSSA
ncbi:hypothetical protein GY45DRAFT_1325897 [Cubamyces sp. BRFM 1775]|nr:hypothetical protein GY45DRAFT_1325897 [Cubamyces sp. BRFM 1775]